MVLLVEDSESIRESVREMLRSLGHSVVEAENADEAERLADLPELDLVLTDIRLKGTRTGLDLADALRKRSGKPIGLMTSLPESSPLRIAAADRFPLLPKPFDTQTLNRFLPTVI